MKRLFELGTMLATPGAMEALENSGDSVLEYITKHVTGVWNELDAHDQVANLDALKTGARVFSAYTLSDGTQIWIITEAKGDNGKRASTTILLPSEY